MITKYISTSAVKISIFSRVRSTSKNDDIFNAHDGLRGVFKKYAD